MVHKRAYDLLNGVSIALLVVIMAGGTAQYVAPRFGWRIEGVRSSSMSPALERGALIIGQPVKPEGIAINDIIIYRPFGGDENTVIHRVISVERSSSLKFITKGDASVIADPYPVSARNVIGRVAFHLPLLGLVAIFLNTPVGFAVAIVLPGATILAMLMQGIKAELKKKRGMGK